MKKRQSRQLRGVRSHRYRDGSAADMAYKAAPVPMAPAVFSWTGFYIGAMLAEPGPATTAAVISHRCSRPLSCFRRRWRSDGIPGSCLACRRRPPRAASSVAARSVQLAVNQFVLGVEADAVGTGLKGSTATASRTIGAPISPFRSPRR